MAKDNRDAADAKAIRREKNAKWQAAVADYQTPNAWRASWQLINTLGSYLVLGYFIYLSLSISWWLTIPLTVIAGGLLVRIFIISHDCGHGSFFKSQRANQIWGFITGMLTFTPFAHWKWEHSIHHATSGSLERRGIGDITTLTVEEYLAMSRWRQFGYRLSRNPFILFVIAPLLYFLVFQRIPSSKAKRREKISVWTMNVAVAGLAACLIAIFGFYPWLIVQLIAMTVAGSGGFWLFYVQHQYEGAYWEREDAWEYVDAAIKGSSYYKLPRIFQWFTANIGFHHIHHLSPKVPNYNLERCHFSNEMFTEIAPLTVMGSLKSLSYRLWDEEARKLISFGQLKRQQKQAQAS